MYTFYLVRHAHAGWQPDENRPLSSQGKCDAEKIANLLRPLAIGAIYSSPYARARQTIAPLARRKNLQLNIAPALRERQLGDFGGIDFDAAVNMTWANPAFAYPGGESNKIAQQRAVHCLQRLQLGHSKGHIVLSTHGNLLALIINHYDPLIGYAFWQSLMMPDVYRLELEDSALFSVNRLWFASD